MTQQMFEARLEHQHDGAAQRQQHREIIRCGEGYVNPRPQDCHERGHHQKRPHQPQLLANDGEDEVGLGLGQVQVLLHGVAQPHAEQAPQGQRVAGVYELSARPLTPFAVVPRVHEQHHALHAVGGDEVNHGRHPCQHHGHEQPHRPPGRAAHDGEGHHGHHADDGGAQVGLGRSRSPPAARPRRAAAPTRRCPRRWRRSGSAPCSGRP